MHIKTISSPRMLLQKLIKQVQTKIVRKSATKTWNIAFGKHLLFTNICTSGLLMAGGDLIEQEIEFRRGILSQRYDWNRVGRMCVVGATLGCLGHNFYGWLARILPKRSMSTVGKKVLLDQFIMSPSCILVFFYTTGLLEGKSLKASTDEIKEKFVEVYTAEWMVWPPVQIINFYYLPVKYQVLYISSVTMLYNVFLSYIKHRDTVLL